TRWTIRRNASWRSVRMPAYSGSGGRNTGGPIHDTAYRLSVAVLAHAAGDRGRAVVTTVAFDGSTMASDSRATDSDAGAVRCVKLFRKRVGKKDHLIGIAGDVFAAMLFVDWYGSGTPAPGGFAHVDTEEDLTVLGW